MTFGDLARKNPRADQALDWMEKAMKHLRPGEKGDQSVHDVYFDLALLSVGYEVLLPFIPPDRRVAVQLVEMYVPEELAFWLNQARKRQAELPSHRFQVINFPKGRSETDAK